MGEGGGREHAYIYICICMWLFIYNPVKDMASSQRTSSPTARGEVAQPMSSHLLAEQGNEGNEGLGFRSLGLRGLGVHAGFTGTILQAVKK